MDVIIKIVKQHVFKRRGSTDTLDSVNWNNYKNRKLNQASMFTVTDYLALWKLFFRLYKIEWQRGGKLISENIKTPEIGMYRW